MAPYLGFDQVGRTPPAPEGTHVDSAHCDRLRNFRQDDIVHALMAQLRERESELALLSEQCQVTLQQQQVIEQTNEQLKGEIDLYSKLVDEKDINIAVLQQKLANEQKSNEFDMAEAKLKHLVESNFECNRILQERNDELSRLKPLMNELKTKVDEYESSNRILQERNDELSQLKPIMKELKTKVDEYESKDGAYVEDLEEALAKAKEEHDATTSAIENLDKKIRGKEWMVKALQEENKDQRSKENHLLVHIEKLNEKLDTYETKFKGRGVDVPMLLAKLKDYDVRTKDLQGQVRRLTNKKLNELVLRSSPNPKQDQADDEKPPVTATSHKQPEIVDDDADNGSCATDAYSLVDNSLLEEEDDEEVTFASQGTDDLDAHDDFDDFLSEVKVGIESLKVGGLCCATRTSLEPTKFRTGQFSPTSYKSQRSCSSRNSNFTYASGRQ
ncbi:hypothetical protein ACHAWF_012874 [Thalassiosira exigua]